MTNKTDDDIIDAMHYLFAGIENDLYAPAPGSLEFGGPLIIEDLVWPGFQKKCECGAESIGVNKHSYWCPKDNV